MSGKTFVYVSSWDKHSDGSDSYGLRGYEYNTNTGEMSLIETVEPSVLFNVSHFDRERGVLYVLEESNDLPGLRGGGGGRVFVFRVDPNTGRLTKIGCTETWCTSPCYLTLDQSRKFMLVAHHGSYAAVTKIAQDTHGNYFPVVERDDVTVELFSVNEDGTLGKLLDVEKCVGDGPARKQMHAHPHTTVMSPSGKLFAVCDKGNDTVSMYQLDKENGKLIRPTYIYRHEPGTMPRYCVFHPEKPWFYHNNESSASVYTFTYTEEGKLLEKGVYQPRLEDCEMQEDLMEQQGFVMSRDGRFLYDIVRGPNVVTVYEIDQENGSLQWLQNRQIPGLWPRGCTLSPDGRFLLVCCRDTAQVVVYPVGENGCLGETKWTIPNNHAAFSVFCTM